MCVCVAVLMTCKEWELIYHDTLLPLKQRDGFLYSRGMEFCALACQLLEMKLIADKEVPQEYIEKDLVWKQRFGRKSMKFPGQKSPPLQQNGYDCGVLACILCDFLCTDRSLHDIQTSLQYTTLYRNHIFLSVVYEKYIPIHS